MKRYVNFVLSFLPTALPVGMTEFNAWANNIVELTGPIADKDSLIWVASQEIMRMPPGKSRVPKRTFVNILRKFAANQLAAAKVNEIKEAQEADRQAALLKQAEDTAAKEVANGVQPTQETP